MKNSLYLCTRFWDEAFRLRAVLKDICWDVLYAAVLRRWKKSKLFFFFLLRVSKTCIIFAVPFAHEKSHAESSVSERG